MPAGEEELVKQEKVPMGAPGWKRVWPEGIWPADIPGGTYIGFNLQSNYTINPNADVTNEFDGIEEVGLLLGGSVGESFSFFGDVDIFEGDELGHIGRLFFQYNNPNRWFNVRLGQFEPRAAPFSNHLRQIRQTAYLTNVLPTLPAGNLFGFSPNQRGIEIWGNREGPGGTGGLEWAFGVVNGQDGGAAHMFEHADEGHEGEEHEEQNGADHAEPTPGQFDRNSNKDVFFRASYKIGGLGVLGSGAGSTLSQTNNWRDDSLTLGGYVYRGSTGATLLLEEHHEEEGEEHTEEIFSPSGNTFYRAGVTVDWWIKDLNLFGGYQLNHDRLRDGREFDVGIATVEANYVTPWPWVQPGVRFEAVNPDFGSSFNRTTISNTLLLRANALLLTEWMFSSKRAPDLPIFDTQFRTSMRFIF
jgi:hypothetical protein